MNDRLDSEQKKNAEKSERSQTGGTYFLFYEGGKIKSREISGKSDSGPKFQIGTH